MNKPLKFLIVLLLLVASVVGTYFVTSSTATNVKVTVDDSVQKQVVYVVAKSNKEDDVDIVKVKTLSLGDELKIDETVQVFIGTKEEMPSSFEGIVIEGVKKLENGNYIVTGNVTVSQSVFLAIDTISPSTDASN